MEVAYMTCKPIDRPTRLVACAGWLVLVLLFILALVPSKILHAEEFLHHEAHEHGVANMNIAVEGNNLYIEFSSPAANIVGFEHHPRTHAQKDAVKDALNRLQMAKALFILSAGSESQLISANVDTDIDNEADDHLKSEHDHADEGHHDQEHHEADEHEGHSEFNAQYHFVCKKPKRLSQIDVRLFSVFPGIEHIEVQLVSETKQTAMELAAKMHKIPL